MQTLSDPIDFQLSYLLHFKKTNRPEEKKEIIERLGPSIMRESGIEKENHIAKLAKALQYEESALPIVLSQNNRRQEKGKTSPFDPYRRGLLKGLNVLISLKTPFSIIC